MVKLIYVAIAMLAISIGGISGSSYGLGITQKNRSSQGYLISTVMLSISLFIFVFSFAAIMAIVSPDILTTVAKSIKPESQPLLVPTQAIPQSSVYSQYNPMNFFAQ